MKTTAFLLLLLPNLLFGQVNSSCAPDDLSTRVMDILRSLQQKDQSLYKESLVRYPQVVSLMNKLQVSDEERQELLEERNQAFIDDYAEREERNLRELGEEAGIDWAKIEFEDFLYRLRLQKGIKELKGTLYFQQGDAHYEVQVLGAELDGKYLLLELESLEMSYELHGYPEGYYEEEEYEQEIPEPAIVTPE